MIQFKRGSDLRAWIAGQQIQARTVGFVPTMGALHSGHIELIQDCNQVCDISVCSIFVNPSQFNDIADFNSYPVSIEKDIEMLEKGGTDVLFLPSVTEIYPEGIKNLETYELGTLETVLEGRFRPGHFQGVCQVMSRLLNSVKPDHLFMGQKDYQQCLVVKKLIELTGIRVQFHSIPTVREPDGLAQSSRNRRLSPDQRNNAIAISQTLNYLRKELHPGNVQPILNKANDRLVKAHFKPDYVQIAAAEDLHPVENWDGSEKVVALIAAFQGEVRLIDNMLLN